MTAPDAATAEIIRKQGNELYKLGKLAEGGWGVSPPTVQVFHRRLTETPHR